MGMDLAGLKKRLELLDVRIEAAQKRLPAHSVPPALMQELLALEDERSAVQKQLLETQETH